MSRTQRRINSVSDPRTKRALSLILGKNWPEIAKTMFEYSNGGIGAAGSAGLSPDIWADCPRGLLLLDPTAGYFTGDNFQTWLPTAHAYELVGTNGTCVQVAGQPHGVIRLTTGATDNDEAAIAYGNDAAGIINANATNNWWFEARVKVNQGDVAKGLFVGLGEETGIGDDLFTNDTMAMKVIDSIGFQLLAATDIAATWQTMMQLTGGARVAINTSVATPQTTSFIKLGMKSVLGTVTFYVNGVAATTRVLSSATNFPLDQVMSPVFGIKTGKAAAVTMDIDWWYAAQLR